jgi:hypothetical protein
LARAERFAACATRGSANALGMERWRFATLASPEPPTASVANGRQAHTSHHLAERSFGGTRRPRGDAKRMHRAAVRVITTTTVATGHGEPATSLAEPVAARVRSLPRWPSCSLVPS